jgi:hypothetical protein
MAFAPLGLLVPVGLCITVLESPLRFLIAFIMASWLHVSPQNTWLTH